MNSENTTPKGLGKRLSLRAKILTVLLSLLAIEGAVSFFSINKLVNNYDHMLEKGLEDSRDRFQSTVAALFFERYGDVQAFAVNAQLATLDKSTIVPVLDNYVKLYGIYQGILVVDSEGRFVAANSKGPDDKPTNTGALEGRSFASEPWFVDAKRGAFLSDSAKGITGSYVSPVGRDPIASALSGKDVYGIHFSAPLKNSNGDVVGVVTTRSDFAWVEAEAAQAMGKMKSLGMSSAMFNLVDANGVVILDYDLSHSKGERDLSIVGKLNAKTEGGDDVKKALAGQSGVTKALQAREKIEVVSAYGPFKSPKVPDALGWSVFVQAEPEEVYATAQTAKREFYIEFGVVFVASIGIGLFITHLLSKGFTGVAEKLKESAEKTASVAKELTHASRESAQSISSQAAAVQETVASMAEMTSMIAQTSQNARESLVLTNSATTRAEDGNRIMQRLVNSMDSIQQANAQLQNIASIISEIANKTAVINDIVFKTQLLSFNASIEAARAGPHGRGFAVVAAEVGNLAQMSGTAAKEIQALLDDSKRQVEGILEGTQERVTEGQTVSAEALATFGDIAKTIERISEQIRGINDATAEQEIGVKQTGIAMAQMDSLSQRNNVVAQQVSGSAEDLETQAERLYRIMQATRVLVLGVKTALRTSGSEGSHDVIDDLLGGAAPTATKQANAKASQLQAQETATTRRKPATPDTSNLLNRLKARKTETRSDAKTLEPAASDGGLSQVDVSADDESFRAS